MLDSRKRFSNTDSLKNFALMNFVLLLLGGCEFPATKDYLSADYGPFFAGHLVDEVLFIMPESCFF
jgi:hypothetical protein